MLAPVDVLVSTMRVRLLAAATALAAAPVSSALAADPSSGKVGAASPSVSWTGELTAPYAVWLQWYNDGGTAECSAPACDSFALEVADGPANLTITLDAKSTTNPADAGAFESIRVVKPDGTTAYVNNTEPDKPTKLLVKAAKSGAYAIDVSTGAKTDAAYEAKAELAVAPAAPAVPAPGPAPAPAPAPSPGPAPAPAPAEDFELTVTAPKVSARKARKGARVKAGVSVSREVASVEGVLRKGSKVVGRGRLGRLAGSGTLSVKLAKALKAGRYSLTVAARDARGVVVTRTVAVTVKR